uniref:Uncharacterized protein n=1 Tax=Avena sativa TaxID=4498 RepID=A0ACD6AGB0_AVESA
MVRPPRTSTGRHRIQEMRLIPDESKRHVTFSKRRPTLFKACSHLSLDFPGTRAAAIVFSRAGKVYAVGCPSVDAAVLINDDAAAVDDDLGALEELRGAKEAAAKHVADKMQRMKAVGDKVLEAQAGRSFWWEADTEMLGEPELPDFATALHRLRDNVSRHVNRLARRPPSPEAPIAQGGDAAAYQWDFNY